MNYLRTALLCLITSFFLATHASALSIILEQEKTSLLKSEYFIVHSYVDTDTESINAFEAKLLFPNDKLELIDVQDGNSFITFWLEKPEGGQGSGVSLSGIIPGGYSGDRAYLASFIFKTKVSGNANVSLEEVRGVLNKEEVKTVFAKTAKAAFTISNDATTTVRDFITTIEDNNPPEQFRPEITQDETLFDGKHFIVFAAQDKGSGIDRFEIKEGRKDSFVVAESPYVLKDQTLKSVIYIKAYDKKGNVREQIVYGEYWKPWYQSTWFVLAVLLLVIVFSVFYLLYLKRRK